MIEYLEQLDRKILFFINGHHSPLLDQLMWVISGKITWIPLLVLFAFFSYKKFSWKGLFIYFFGVIACIALADLISFRLIKNIVQRYRPSHNIEIKDQLHYFIKSNGEVYLGGLYGFVSSHAANFFALFTFTTLFFSDAYRKWCYFFFVCCLLIVYSRIYLGVHYPSDIVGGAILGCSLGYLLGRCSVYFLNQTKKQVQ
jgi:undecaprenyl-diphosphatase